jgi:hypothetical protein
MLILKFILFLISVYVPGYLLVRLLLAKQVNSRLKAIALAFGLGGLFITLQLFILLALCRLTVSNWIWLLFAVETLLLLYWHYKKYGWHCFASVKVKEFKLKEGILLLLIGLQALFSLSNCLARPIIAYDSLVLWTMRAKILFFNNNAMSFDSNSFYYLGGYWHNNYPWHSSLLQYWMSFVFKDFNELAINLIFWLFFMSVLLFLYTYLRDYIQRFYALLFTFFLASMPLFFYHSSNPYSDLPLSYFLLIAFVFLLKWLEHAKQQIEQTTLKQTLTNSWLFWSGIFFGAAFLIKLDAIIFVLAALLIVVAVFVWQSLLKTKQGWQQLGSFVIALILPNIFWIVFMISYHLGISNVAPGLGWHPQIWKQLIESFFLANNWNIWWFAFFTFSVIYIKVIWKHKDLFWGYVLLLVTVCGFVVLYLFTNQYEFVVNHTAVSRNVLLFVPLSVFLIARLFAYEPTETEK